MGKLTKKQQVVYDYIVDFIDRQGYPPSVREITAAVGLKSPSTVQFHLRHLEKLGVIEKLSGKVRTITLTDPSVKSGRVRGVEEPEQAGDLIPIVGDVAAGSPILAQESIEDYLVFDTCGREDEFFALRVRGESMLNAGILPGDLVIVHRQQGAGNGEIVVAMLNDEATVKRLSMKNHHIWLLPENDRFSPIDGTHAQILGKVTAVVRRYS